MLGAYLRSIRFFDGILADHLSYDHTCVTWAFSHQRARTTCPASCASSWCEHIQQQKHVAGCYCGAFRQVRLAVRRQPLVATLLTTSSHPQQDTLMCNTFWHIRRGVFLAMNLRSRIPWCRHRCSVMRHICKSSHGIAW